MRREALPKIAAVAADQWGMITSAQAASVGVDARTLSRLAGTGELERLSHGIYRLAGSPPGPHDDLRAAWLAIDPRRTAADRIGAGPTEIVSHRSATILHEIGDLEADLLEFTTSTRRQTRRPDVVFHRGVISADGWTLAGGLPVTTPLRTVADLAAARIDRGHLATALRDAMLLHGVTAAAAAAALASHARAYGAPATGGRELVGILLREAGAPQSALDVAAQTGQSARRPPADRLMDQSAIEEAVQVAVRRALADLASRPDGSAR
jgi:hypothetical protein